MFQANRLTSHAFGMACVIFSLNLLAASDLSGIDFCLARNDLRESLTG